MIEFQLGGTYQLPATQWGKNGMKLIVVDDEHDVRATVANFLVDIGYCVIQAENGTQALVLITEEPDLCMMISDIRMPGMSGVELAEEAVRLFPKLRVILISGFADPQRLRWPLLRKPFRMSSLGVLVAREIAGA